MAMFSGPPGGASDMICRYYQHRKHLRRCSISPNRRPGEYEAARAFFPLSLSFRHSFFSLSLSCVCVPVCVCVHICVDMCVCMYYKSHDSIIVTIGQGKGLTLVCAYLC